MRTLNQEALARASQELAGMAAAFQPDILIGIRSGGYVVAELMRPYWPEAPLFPISRHRAGTARKQHASWLKKALPALPYAITNPLRIAEHIMLTQLRPPVASSATADPKELAAIASACAGAMRILIIDDAVDSGATLLMVYRLIQAAAPQASIKTAALTVTTASPLLQPDFFLYRYALCRFPWSFDFKA